MDNPGEFQTFIAQLQAGDPVALQQAYARYLPTLRLAVRSQLPDDVRSRFDSLDFVQDVWASFLARPGDQNRYLDSRALLAFLCRVARNKVTDVARRRFRADPERALLESEEACHAIGFRDRAPSPSQQLMADEEFEKLVVQFPPGHRMILRRLRDGLGAEEIARASGVSLSTVNRVVRRLRELAGDLIK